MRGGCVKTPSVNDVAAAEAATNATLEVENDGGPVVPVFGLKLPRLPSLELTLQEQRFMFAGFERFLPQEQTRADEQEAVRTALGRFDDPETFDDAPLEAFRELGLAAVRPSRQEDLPFFQPTPGSSHMIDEIIRDLLSLRRSVWNGIERWQQSARTHPSLEGRRQAVAQLRKFAAMLIPDTRGKRKEIGPPPTHLQLGYRQLLFRLQLARQLSGEEIPAGQAPGATLAEISRGSGLPENWVRGWLFFSDRWERKPRPQSLKRMALELLAEVAGQDPESVATLISRGRGARTRKRTPT